MSTKLSDVKTEFEKYLVIRDPYAIDLIMATLVSNLILPSDPLWVLLVATASGGKSTLMAPTAAINHVHFIDDLTDKTFLSGYKIGKTETSLLKVIGDGVMCFSDFTTILAKDSITRGEILSQFRVIYDGDFRKRTGTGLVEWKGKMGMLAASTPDVYFQLESARSMGERFVYYNISQPTDQEIVEKQEQVKMSSKQITEKMKEFYLDYFVGVRDFAARNGVPELNINSEFVDRIHKAAIFCVSGKTSVHTDYKTGKPDNMPNKPGVGRDRKMFNTLLRALQLMYAYETDNKDAEVQESHIRLVEKCAYSSINRERRKCLEILASVDVPLTSASIGNTDDFGLPKEAIEKHILPLFSVGLVKRQKVGNAYAWFLDDKDRTIRDFVKSMTEDKPKEIGKDDGDDAAEEEYNRW